MSNPAPALAIAAVLSLGFAGQALAHAKLVSAVPPAGESVAGSPTELDLKFSEAVNLEFSGAKVTGPDKAEIKLDQPMLMDGDTTWMATISDKLAPGAYSVEWHALSADGHKTTGSYTFTVQP